MIQSKNLTKRFNNTLALDSLTTSIEDGKIYGLVGSNGAGKSTFLRLLAGVYRPTEGRIMINGKDVYENPVLKSELFFIPDEIYQMPGLRWFAGKDLFLDLSKLVGIPLR